MTAKHPQRGHKSGRAVGERAGKGENAWFSVVGDGEVPQGGIAARHCAGLHQKAGFNGFDVPIGKQQVRGFQVADGTLRAGAAGNNIKVHAVCDTF